jgi:hypothetical protein
MRLKLLFFENSQTSSLVGYGKRRRINQQWFSLTREHTPMLVRGQSEDEDEKRKVLSSTVKMEGPKLAAKRKGKERKERKYVGN